MWAALRNQNLRRGLIALALFFVGSYLCDYFFGPALFPRLMNGLSVAAAIAVLIIYSKVIRKALRSEVPDRVELLTLGIGTTWLAILAGRIWFTITITEHGGTMADVPFSDRVLSFVLAMFVVGAAQHISASGKLGQSLPTFSLRLLFGGCIVGALAFGFYVGHFVR